MPLSIPNAYHFSIICMHFLTISTYRGLSHSGEEGVFNVLKLLNDELALAMKLMGATTISVSTHFIVRAHFLFFYFNVFIFHCMYFYLIFLNVQTLNFLSVLYLILFIINLVCLYLLFTGH